MELVKEHKGILDKSQHAQRMIVAVLRYTLHHLHQYYSVLQVRACKHFDGSDTISNSNSGSQVHERCMSLSLISLDATVNYIRVCLKFGFIFLWMW